MSKTRPASSRARGEGQRRIDDLEDQLAKSRRALAQQEYELSILRTAANMQPEDVLHAAAVEVRCQRLEAQLATCTADVASAREQCKYFERHAQTLAGEIERLHSDLSTRDQALAALEHLPSFGSVPNDQLVELRSQQVLLKERLEQSVQDAHESQQRCQRLLEELEESSKSIRTAQQLQLASAAEAEDARRTWREGHYMLEQAQQERDTLRTDNERLRHELTISVSAVNELRASEESLKNRCRSLSGQLEAVKGEMACHRSTGQENRRLREDLSALDEQHRSDASIMSNLREELQVSMRRIAELEHANAALAGEVSLLRDKESVLKDQLDTLETSLGRQLRTVKASAAASADECLNLERKLAAAEKKISTLNLINAHQHSLREATLRMADSTRDDA